MLKKLMAVAAAAILLSACDEPQTATTAPPAAPVVAPPSFMVFFDWDRSNLSAQALNTVQQAATTFKTRSSARITAMSRFRSLMLL